MIALARPRWFRVYHRNRGDHGVGARRAARGASARGAGRCICSSPGSFTAAPGDLAQTLRPRSRGRDPTTAADVWQSGDRAVPVSG